MKSMSKILILLLLAGGVAGALALKARKSEQTEGPVTEVPQTASRESASITTPQPKPEEAPKQKSLPMLLDLGADKCVPCKMMAPILDELKKEYDGRMTVSFVDVWKNPTAKEQYGINLIPTQIFFDAAGKELFRHEGFYSKEDILAKWKELGVDLGAPKDEEPTLSRWEPAQPDARPKDAICYLCDGDINPKTRTTMKTPAGDVAFCSPHCYIITYASLTNTDKTHGNASVADWTSGASIPVADASYLYGVDRDGRPTIQAFASEAAAKEELTRSGGNVLPWDQLETKEVAALCAFCDRPVYPDDASIVRVNGMQTWGCCTMCALGVAARTGKDIEVDAKDALTGDPIRVKTFDGHVAELDPPTAVAWAGARKDSDGNIKSTGCFKQAFFVSDVNLKKWVDEHPTATGRQVTIEQALADKMRLSPQEINKACKIGECVPK